MIRADTLLKVNVYTFSGEVTLTIIFASHLIRCHLIKKRIWSKLFPLRVDPILKGRIVQESKQEATEVVPLCKMVEMEKENNKEGTQNKTSKISRGRLFPSRWPQPYFKYCKQSRTPTTSA